MSLSNILQSKKEEVEMLKRAMPLNKLKERLKYAKEPRNFLQAFKKGFSIIAEIKRASPSEGIIDNKADIVGIAKQYEKGGASAISVLTDKKFFNGNTSFLQKVKDAVSLPVLRKDFIIDEYQIYGSRAYGADAILLIVAALSNDELEHFIDLAHSLGMECLVELHSEDELKRIRPILEKISAIGINARDLETMKLDTSIVQHLVAKLPKDKLIISESGITSANDARKIRNLGVDGILVGTFLMRQADKAVAIRSLLS